MSLDLTRPGGNAPGLPGPTLLPPLTAALSRRRALFGAVTAAGITAASTASAANAFNGFAWDRTSQSTASPASVEAAALQADAGRLSREYRVSMCDADAAFDATPEVEAPEALFARNGDGCRLWMRSPVRSFLHRRFWYGDADLVDELRAATFRRLDGTRDEVAATRRDEIVGGWDAWQGAIRAAEDLSGYTAAQARFDAAHDAYAAFRLRLAELRTADPEVLAVKAAVVRDLCERQDGRLDAILSRLLRDEHGAYEGALALSMARDVVAMLGADRGVAA